MSHSELCNGGLAVRGSQRHPEWQAKPAFATSLFFKALVRSKRKEKAYRGAEILYHRVG